MTYKDPGLKKAKDKEYREKNKERITMKEFIGLAIPDSGVNIQKVAAIKGIRGLTGKGLKESKELVDKLIASETSTTIEVIWDLKPEDYDTYINYLKRSNLIINNDWDREDPIIEEILNKLNTLMAFCNITGHYNITRSLQKVVENNYPTEHSFRE